MAEALREYVESQKPAKQKRPSAAAKILARLDYDVTALVAGKYLLDCISLLQTLNKASIRIGEALEMECRLERLDALSMAVQYMVEYLAKDQDLAVDDRLKDMRQKSIDKFMESAIGIKPREKTWINLV